MLLWTGIALIAQNIAGFLGIACCGFMAQRVGRRPTFAVAFIGAMLSTGGVFWYLREFSQIFWMIPLMGFFVLSLFGGYALYFPELFPTHLRSTGISFCYNVGRFVAAIGPFLFGYLSGVVYKDQAEPIRYTGVTMCVIFLFGLLALPFAPETRGQPLPEFDSKASH